MTDGEHQCIFAYVYDEKKLERARNLHTSRGVKRDSLHFSRSAFEQRTTLGSTLHAHADQRPESGSEKLVPTKPIE
jgi:hypothetical protein